MSSLEHSFQDLMPDIRYTQYLPGRGKLKTPFENGVLVTVSTS